MNATSPAILRFSIVIPTFNRKEMLTGALASVAKQNWPCVEIIIVDGGSTDGTVEQLESSPNLRLLKGPDRGVYDALNKGIAAASGDIVGLLNSDDIYEPGAFAAIAAAFASNANADSVCGTALLEEDDSVLAIFDRDADKVLATPRPIFIGACIPNARFFRRSALANVGPFSLDYRYIADRDWLARWYEAKLTTIAVPQLVYRYRQHPGSLTFDRGRQSEVAIRTELITLAQRWRTNHTASVGTQRIAELLEGRCRATLALAALRRGKPTEAFRWFSNGSDGTAARVSLAMMTRTGIDWLTQATAGRTSL